MIDEYGMLLINYGKSRPELEISWIDSTISQLQGPPRPPVRDPKGLVPRQRERRVAALAQVAEAPPRPQGNVGKPPRRR